MLKILVLTLLLAVMKGQMRNDPFKTLINYEQKQRSSAQLDSIDYTLVPFKLSHQPQHLILSPLADQTLSVEVVVHWLGNNSALNFPLFNLTEKVRLTIEEETYGVTIQKPAITKQFLTQTGFKIKILGGKKYRMRVESIGRQVKLVQIAMTDRHKQVTIYEPSRKNHTNQMRVLSEMKQNLQMAQNKWASRMVNFEKQQKVSSFWAWMSGIEMISLLVFVGVQMALFQKFSLPSSII